MRFPTEQAVFEAAVAYFTIAHRDPVTGRSPELGPSSFLGQEARALSQLIGEVLSACEILDGDAVPNVSYDSSGALQTRNSTRRLDDWAVALALPGSGGKLGRRGPTQARNGGASAAGTPGTIVPTGALLSDPSTNIVVKLRAGFVMPASGSYPIVLDAVAPGAAGRLPAGTPLRWQSPPPGLGSTLVLSAGLSGGGDAETDVELALRIVARLQARPKGGSAADYREWAEAAEDASGMLLGIARAYVYPVRDGAGSVTVCPLVGGVGRGRDPGATVASQVLAWLNKQKIVTDTVYVVRPRFPTGEELTITVSVEPQPGNEFDWRNVPSVQANSLLAGSKSLIINQSPPPPTLRDAIDNASKPRLAINFSASPIPFVASVLSYALDTPSVGYSTLQLDTELPATVAMVQVLPAGGATLPIAAAIVQYIGSLGPSRSSGYGNPDDPWEDGVTVAKIAKVALSATDSGGALVCRNSPSVGLGVGIQIAVGTNPATASDFLTFDNVPGQGPQLAEVAAVIVKAAT